MTPPQLDLLGIGEIDDLLPNKEGYASVLKQRGQLPAPDSTINRGRNDVWRRVTIERWLARRNA